jgi:transposase
LSNYREYGPAVPSLIGYDPCFCLPTDHLARLVDEVVEESIIPEERKPGPGQPRYDPRLCIKVLVYAYATGVRSSRQMEKNCRENLPYLFLTRGDTPSYRVLCHARVGDRDLIEEVWMNLFEVGDRIGLKRVGRIVVDSSKLRANATREMILDQDEYEAVKDELKKILTEAEAVDVREDREGYEGETRTGKKIDKCQMRDIVRSVRRRRER